MVAAPDGCRMSTLISGLANYVQPAWSPDGTQIAWPRSRDPGRRPTEPRRLADETAGPQLRPRHGSLTVFDRRRDGSVDLSQLVGGDTQTADGYEARRPMVGASEPIAFASYCAGTRDFWTMPTNSCPPIPSTRATMTGLLDYGTKIAFTSDREGGPRTST